MVDIALFRRPEAAGMNALLKTPHHLVKDGLTGLVPGRGFGAVGLVAGSGVLLVGQVVLNVGFMVLIVGPVALVVGFAGLDRRFIVLGMWFRGAVVRCAVSVCGGVAMTRLVAPVAPVAPVAAVVVEPRARVAGPRGLAGGRVSGRAVLAGRTVGPTGSILHPSIDTDHRDVPCLPGYLAGKVGRYRSDAL